MATEKRRKTGTCNLFFCPAVLLIHLTRIWYYLAIISVYNKTGLLDLAKGLKKNDIRLLASGGTAKMIREAGFDVE